MIDYSRVMKPDLPFVYPDDYMTEQEEYEAEQIDWQRAEEIDKKIKVKNKSMLGQELRIQRVEEGLSLRDLEKVLGIGYALLCKYENGMMEPFPKHFDIILNYFDDQYAQEVLHLHAMKKAKQLNSLSTEK